MLSQGCFSSLDSAGAFSPRAACTCFYIAGPPTDAQAPSKLALASLFRWLPTGFLCRRSRGEGPRTKIAANRGRQGQKQTARDLPALEALPPRAHRMPYQATYL
jgi:hypothetical protein